jgi:hypothetical protein
LQRTKNVLITIICLETLNSLKTFQECRPRNVGKFLLVLR